MATNFWTQKNKKLIVSASMIILAWPILSGVFPTLWKIPTFFTTKVFGGISLMVVAAGFALFGVFMLWKDY